MELTPLRYFRVMARVGHMTRAAEELGVTQPALSAMLRKLEEEVGAELFHRTGRGVELSEAGRIFLTHADQAVREADSGVAAVRALLGLEHGALRVGGGATATTYVLPGVLSCFRREHPGLRFFIREGGSSAVAEAVLEGELDLGIVTMPVTTPGADDLAVTRLASDELVLIVPPGHRLSRQRTFRWHDLDGETVVAFEAGSAVRRLIDEAAREAGVRLDVAMELRSIETIKEMVRVGVGVGFVSRFALPDGSGIAHADAPLVRDLAIVRRRDRIPSPAAKALENALLVHASRPRVEGGVEKGKRGAKS